MPVTLDIENIRALLQFGVEACDVELENHLRTAASNATYISKTTQNQLIHVSGDVIRDKIVERRAEGKYFADLTDETTDVSQKEQTTMVVRYVDTDIVVREDFIGFVHV